MISRETLDRAIAEHENGDTSYANCERLAWLYIVRDHIAMEDTKENEQKKDPAKSFPTYNGGDSDFLKAIDGKSGEKVIYVMDEAMQAIQVLQPRLYDATIQKLKNL